MKTMALVVVAFLAAGEAQAQGSGYPSGAFDGVTYVGLAIDSTFAIAGLLTAVNSTERLERGQLSKPWLVASAVTGSVNLGLGAVFLWGATRTNRPGLNPVMAGIAAGHLAIGVWNVLMPVLGFRAFSPMVINGRFASGRRWTGLGIQAGF